MSADTWRNLGTALWLLSLPFFVAAFDEWWRFVTSWWEYGAIGWWIFLWLTSLACHQSEAVVLRREHRAEP